MFGQGTPGRMTQFATGLAVVHDTLFTDDDCESRVSVAHLTPGSIRETAPSAFDDGLDEAVPWQVPGPGLIEQTQFATGGTGEGGDGRGCGG